jgi:enediyne biosynthesis protein E4
MAVTLRARRVLLACVFAALLATPAVLRWQSARVRGPVEAGRHGFHLVDAAAAAGLVHQHEAPTLDPQLNHIMPQVASMGAAVSIVDFDRDGWDDVYATTSREGGRNRLFRNLGDGTFVDVAPEVGLADVNGVGVGVSMGAVWGDADNDGFEDLLLYRWGRQELFRNIEGRQFEAVTSLSAWPARANINSAVWFDFDRDGWLDVLLAGYFDERVDLWSLASTRMMPESFEYARNGGRKYLMRNLGGGRFVDVTEAAGIVSRRWALAVVAADLRGTGDQDLIIANDYGVSEYFLNEGGRFREVGRETGIGRAPKSGMNASIGDVLNQGRFGIYVSNISEDGILLQGNNFWMPTTNTGSLPTYENLATAMGIEQGGWSFGAQFGDLNNDGWQDLYLVNGFVSADRDRSYWYDYSKIAGGHEVVIGDARNWPAMEGRSLAGYQPKRVWVNTGSGQFLETAAAVGVTDRYDGRAVVMADLGNRGALDVVAANQRGPLVFYRNRVAAERRWVAISLEGQCRPDATSRACSNRSAIGAQVVVRWQGRQQVQDVSGGTGFASQNARRLHFGLGEGVTTIDEVTVRWPSGARTVLRDLATNQVHVIREGV